MGPAVVQMRIDIGGTKFEQWRRIKVVDQMTIKSFFNYITLIYGMKFLNKTKRSTSSDLFLESFQASNMFVLRSKRQLKDLRLQKGQRLMWEDSKNEITLIIKIEEVHSIETGELYPVCIAQGQNRIYNSISAMNDSQCEFAYPQTFVVSSP